ncbi:MAG: type II toxin-antitoxin system RelB/DinJ family antitoxin [bacterium]|nr:type II toxin-antitoxin system RelB/DinJ family antitoxin [bacterium]
MKTVISVKVDKDVRDRARKVARQMGVPLSMVVNSGLRQFAQEERIVFQTEKVYRMTKKFEKKLEKIEADIKAGRNLSPEFKTAAEMDRYLDGLKK